MVEIQKPSPNKSSRTKKRITAILLHDTGGKGAGAVEWLTNKASGVSAHVVIDREGKVYRLVPDSEKAWHAGKSSLWLEDNVNEYSLGVELEDTEDTSEYTEAQLESLTQWCAEKCKTYTIPLNRIIGHEHVATPKGRKLDPGPDFHWYDVLLRIAQRITQIPD
jgi:N-acetylmuramoyl-L-alanine amidase